MFKSFAGTDTLLSSNFDTAPLGPTFKARAPIPVKEEAPVTTSAKVISAPTEEKPEEDSALAHYLLAMCLEQQTDQDGMVNGNGITDFVSFLEKAGIDANPIKSIIEKVTGQTYAAFAADPSHRYAAADFYNYGGTRSNIPHITNVGFDSDRAIRIAQSDNAGAGNCAKGTANVLLNMGYSVTRGNATNWDTTLLQNGWVRLRGVDPRNAPEGSVLVFNNNQEAGLGACNNGHGAQFGHVEAVAETSNGHRVYVSDAVRNNPGGSVPENYAGAFMYVGPNAPASNLQIVAQINGGGAQMASNRHHAPAPSPA